MGAPATLSEMLIVVAVVLPGLVFATVRSWLRGLGPEDVSAANRVAQALVIGVLFDLLYLVLLGQHLLAATTLDTPRDVQTLAGYVIVLGIAFPALVSYAAFGRPFRRMRVLGRDIVIPLTTTPYRSTPTAWDRKIPHLGGKFVRIRLPDGYVVAGWYGGHSYASTYPHPRDIYLEHQYGVTEDDCLVELDGSQQTAGVWVSVPDGSTVIFTHPPLEKNDD